jgi:hypothetical protein
MKKLINNKHFVKITITLYSQQTKSIMTSKITHVLLFSLFALLNFTANAFNVTFRVDMSQQSGYTTPQVSGNFISWAQPFLSLTDANGDQIWEGTANIAAGSFEYKFTADNWGMQETLLAGSTCTTTNFGFTNRTLVVSGDVVLPVVCWGACVDCAFAPSYYDVTFQVDMNEMMSNIDSVFTTPEVNGTFNGWCGNCNAMTDANGDGIWSTTITLMEGDYDYKFSHDAWGGQEPLSPGSLCTMTSSGYTNRVLSLTQDVVLPPVCYGSCAACGVSTGPFDVIFSVDMSNVDSAFTTPEVNGTFNGWCGNCAAMSDPEGDNVWTITIPLETGIYDFKYSYDNWAGQEALTSGSSCTTTTGNNINRTINVSGPMDMGIVCWERCEACNAQPPLLQMDLPVTFDDTLVEYGFIGFDGAENSQIVIDPTDATNHVARVVKSAAAGASAGTTITAPAELGFAMAIPFTSAETFMNVRVWSPTAGTPVRLKVEDHTNPTHSVETQATTTMAGAWEVLTFDFSNESAGTAALNLTYTFDKATIFFNFGTPGAVAGEQTYYFDDVQFGQGEVVVVPQHNITFQVDMQNVTGFTTVEVNGTFNNWCGNCFPLSDVDGDGIWTGSAMLDEGTHEYKFTYNSFAGQENLLSSLPCTVTNFGFTNRSLNVSSDTTLSVVCWESCGDCSSAPTSFDVTFQVDMNGVIGFANPEVNGTFNGWCGNCFQMSDVNADGIWEATTTLQEGDYQFKYSYDNWGGQEQLTAGDPCTVTDGQYVNRVLSLHNDTVMAPVCWALCGACQVQQPVNVTFNVDLGTLSATSVEVAGTFNGFCVACAPMMNTSGSMYSITLPIMPGVYEYFYTINGGETAEVLAADVCTIEMNGSVTREIVVSEDVNIAMVCWESCQLCPMSVNNNLVGEMQLYPNPANSSVRLVMQNSLQAQYSIIDATGRVVMSGNTMGRMQIDFPTQQLSEGVYQVRVADGTRVLATNLLIQH